MEQEKDTHYELANAPENLPISFNRDGKLFLSRPDSEGGHIDMSTPNSVSGMGVVSAVSQPQWVRDFFQRMDSYVKAAAPSVSITDDGLLILDEHATSSDLKSTCSHLAWLYESSMRQNKEILVWIGEITLDYMARSAHDPTIEEAIEELGFLDRENGMKWKLSTLAKWVIVAQRIPSAIRQLPLPQTYLSEAALFSQPEDPDKRIMFNNIRDAMLLSAAESPQDWSRKSFSACMKELQHEFGVESHRNEGVASLQSRLIALYRVQREVNLGHTTYEKIGVGEQEVAAWIYNIEAELQYRKIMNPDPVAEIPVGDGLTLAARGRIIKKSEAVITHEQHGK